MKMTIKIGVLTDFTNFTGKQLRWSLFLIKMQTSVLQLYYKETLTELFSCEIFETFKNPSFYRTPLVAASDCLCKKFSEYPHEMLGISVIVCSIPQHFSWFENYKLC